MAVPPWNHTWTGGDVAGYTLHEIFLKFRYAIVQRLYACNPDLDVADYIPDNDPTTVVSTPALESRIAVFLDTVKNFGEIASHVIANANRFVRRYNGDGSDYVIAGKKYVDSLVWHVADDTTETALTFPYPNGWTRKFPREIWTLSQTGSDGDRARFVSLGHNSDSLSGQYRSALTTDGTYGTNVTTPRVSGYWSTHGVVTPDDERQYSGKIMERVSGDWVVADDQRSGPDRITEMITGVASHTWTPAPGDYFGEWVLNDLQSAINQMNRIMMGQQANTTPSTNDLKIVDDFAQIKFGSGFSSAAAISAYNASTPGDGGEGLFDPPPDGGLPYAFTERDGGSYFAGTQKTELAYGAEGEGAITRPDPFGIEGTFTPYLKSAAYDDSSGPTPTFDAYGDPVANSATLAEWTGAAATGDINTSVFVGNLHGTCPSPFASADHFRGWMATEAIVIVDFNIPTGFAFTEDNDGDLYEP